MLGKSAPNAGDVDLLRKLLQAHGPMKVGLHLYWLASRQLDILQYLILLQIFLRTKENWVLLSQFCGI